MLRSVLVVFGGAVTSMALLIVSKWVVLLLAPIPTVAGPGQFEAALQHEVFDRYIVVPVVALLTGLVVGIFARGAPGWLAVLAVAPLTTLFLSGHTWSVNALAFAVAYVLLAAGAAVVLARWRNARLVRSAP